MAMNKKEQAAMKAAIDRAEMLAALRWTKPVLPDVNIPETGYTEGWNYNRYTMRADKAWSSTVSHGTGPLYVEGRKKIGSQEPQPLYSTEALALAAMRHEIEKKAAALLLTIDRQIAALEES
jgi:hypothetical protein